MSRLYGSNTYSSTTYGTDVITEPLFGLSVDWARNGYFSGRNEAQYLDSFTISRGRQSYIKSNGEGFEEEDIGKMSATISDPNGDFNPFNTASPLYGILAPNKRMEMKVVSLNGNTYPLMAGSISNVIPMRGIINKVRLEAHDGWTMLRGNKASVTIPLQENIYCDDILPLILTAVNWPAFWGHDLDAGQDVQPYWWIDRKSAAEAIFDVVFSELGRTFIKGNGALAFRNRFAVGSPVATITDADYIYDSLDVSVPWETQRNVVTVYARPRVKQASQVLWSLPSAVLLTAGQTYEFWPEFRYNNESVPAKNIISPAATTDYLVNLLEDGSGTDRTADLSVTIETFANQCKLIVVLSGADAYLRTLSVRGEPISNDNAVPMRASNVAPNEDNLEFTLDAPWIQNVLRADSFDDYLLNFLVEPKNYVRFTLKPNPDVQFALDLGDTVRLNSALLGVNMYYSISYIEHKHTRKQGYTMTSLVLEPLPETSSYWRFGVAQFGTTTMFAP